MHKSSNILLVLFISLSIQGIAQKKGTFFKADNPICQLWEYQVPEISNSEEEEMTDEKYEKIMALQQGPKLFAGLNQTIFFLLADGSQESIMAAFEDREIGFACPTYFQASYDSKFIYCKVGESCALDVPESEKFIAISYTYDATTNQLTLIVDGVSFLFVPWVAAEVEYSNDLEYLYEDEE